MGSHSITTVGVIGTGLIGSSWTALFLSRGLKVIVTDPAPEAETKLRDYLEKTCPVVPGCTLTVETCLRNLTFVTNIDPYLESVDLIQDVRPLNGMLALKRSEMLIAVNQNGPERLPLKRSLIAHLDFLTPTHVPIVSSSSGIPSSVFITECKENPARILIGHPFNPPHFVPLVEIVPHPGTANEHIAAVCDFYKGLDKDPVIVRQETPGFIANRLQAALCAEAYSLIERGVVTLEDLDKTMTSGLGLRWAVTGPIMTNTLGGGGDFGHFMDHLGPALKYWLSDMREHRFDFESQEKTDVLKEKVSEWVSNLDLGGLERRRDEGLAELVAIRRHASDNH
ncbi:hypothetical protein BDV11DRAFT_202742 [Aspergillus similis]